MVTAPQNTGCVWEASSALLVCQALALLTAESAMDVSRVIVWDSVRAVVGGCTAGGRKGRSRMPWIQDRLGRVEALVLPRPARSLHTSCRPRPACLDPA